MRKFTEAQSRLEKIFGLAVELCAVAGMLVAQPSLRITSPPDGTTVHPGESLTVTVEASPPGAFRVVFVAGFEPIGFGKEETDKPPDKFTLQIPSSIRPDKYTVTAGGSVEPNHIISANPIHILVERIDYPVSMIVYPLVADFTMDEKRFLQVTGLYADRTSADLTQSSRIKYVSTAPSVATVQAQGIVTPVAPGTGTITITYGDLKLEVPVKVNP